MNEPHSMKTILVVDDEADMRIFVSTVAETGGYEALTADSGANAMEMARARTPDLVILDVMMPKIEDGIQIFQEFKSTAGLKHIPIIMLSAIAKKTFFHYITLSSLTRGEGPYEPDGYMEKPPEADDLLYMIKTLLQSA
jgi:CheY-like chemotaxis protein